MATDWASHKVPELKAELKRRGQAATGLKADLVARLTELDAAGHSEVAGENEKAISANVDKDTGLDAAVSESFTSPSRQTDIEANGAAKDDIENHLSVKTQQPQSVEPQEVISDLTKRKRRSRSPPPSANDTPRKRIRVDEDLPYSHTNGEDRSNELATSQADSQWVEKHNGMDTELVDTDTAEVPQAEMGRDAIEKVVVLSERANSQDEDSHMRDADSLAAPTSPAQNRDQRYRGVDPDAMKGMEMHDIEASKPDPDRIVEPAIHVATSALYIRDFQRPLNPLALKEHLTILASPSGSPPTSDVIRNFFLDPIRTHALVEFETVSAASRVRSEIHGTIWPDESNRKELWADFIPHEKVQEWRAEEEGAESRPAKKWEVAYEHHPDSGEIYASLREASTVPALRRSSNLDPPRGPMVPPTGPRGFGLDRFAGSPPSGPRIDNNFVSRNRLNGPGPKPMLGRNLDTRVRTTETRPNLNFQYVAKDLANKRLDSLDRATTRKPYDKNGPINRFSFDNGDVLIDRGSERFEGIRPPPGVIRRGNFRDEARGGGRGSGERAFRSSGGYRGDHSSGPFSRGGGGPPRGGGGFGRDDRINSERMALISGGYGRGNSGRGRDRDDGYSRRGSRDDGSRYRDPRNDRRY